MQAWLEAPSLTVKAEAELGHLQPGEVPREGVVVPVEEGGAHHLSKEWTSPWVGPTGTMGPEEEQLVLRWR